MPIIHSPRPNLQRQRRPIARQQTAVKPEVVPKTPTLADFLKAPERAREKNFDVLLPIYHYILSGNKVLEILTRRCNRLGRQLDMQQMVASTLCETLQHRRDVSELSSIIAGLFYYTETKDAYDVPELERRPALCSHVQMNLNTWREALSRQAWVQRHAAIREERERIAREACVLKAELAHLDKILEIQKELDDKLIVLRNAGAEYRMHLFHGIIGIDASEVEEDGRLDESCSSAAGQIEDRSFANEIVDGSDSETIESCSDISNFSFAPLPFD